MRAVHFGGGNIGRGFIGEVLSENGFTIDFIDVNQEIISALQKDHAYTIQYSSPEGGEKRIEGVSGINNGEEPEKVIDAIAKADLVTTAIGPKILPYIAELIAKGLLKGKEKRDNTDIDVIACENMIGGSQFLKSEVMKYVPQEDLAGFPNAAVDRIVPNQKHEDVLTVAVEPFKEWVVDVSQTKSPIRLEGVHYVDNLEPYIERKLFSVNTGHATTAYTGFHYGYKTIDEAMQDEKVVSLLKKVLKETGDLLIMKWGFDPEEHKAYQETIVERFANPEITDDITRVARTPIRKLGFDERFIRPLREAKERNLPYEGLLEVIGYIFSYDVPEDEESVRLMQLLKEKEPVEVIREVTGLKDEELIEEIAKKIQ